MANGRKVILKKKTLSILINQNFFGTCLSKYLFFLCLLILSNPESFKSLNCILTFIKISCLKIGNEERENLISRIKIYKEDGKIFYGIDNAIKTEIKN